MDHEAATTRSLPASAPRRLENLHGAEVLAAIASLAVILFGFLNG